MKLSTQRSGSIAGEVRDVVAMLGAFCLFLSTIEYMVPKPLPFMRIGIANLPIMLALDLLPAPAFFLLVAIKVIGQSLVSGSLFSYIFLFSLLGSFSSAALMFGLRRLFGAGRTGFIGIGCVGALASNLTQILLARAFVFGESAKYVAPPFLAAGVATGIALGLFCETFVSRSVWYAERASALKDGDRGRT